MDIPLTSPSPAAELHCAGPGGVPCGRPAGEHTASPETGRPRLGHEFVSPPFPTDKSAYEVWEVRNGQPYRLAASHMPKKAAVATAQEWTAEAEAGFAAESPGPVKPVRRGFIAVHVTTQRTPAR